MRTRSSSPPIHVHVSDTTPVHVHVKSQRMSPARTPQVKGFFFIKKIHDVICFCVCSYSSLVNEHLLKIFEFGYLVTHVIQCSCYAWTGLTDVTDMLLHSLCVLKGETKVNRGSLRPTAKVKTRVPWIPPGKASTRDASYKWEVK